MVSIWQEFWNSYYIASIWQAFGKYLASIWQTFGKYLASIRQVFGKYLARICVLAAEQSGRAEREQSIIGGGGGGEDLGGGDRVAARGQFEKSLSGSSQEWKQATFAFRNLGEEIEFKIVLLHVGSLSALGSCSSPDQLGAD